MIVTRYNFNAWLAALEAAPCLALDCETTGLRPYHGDRLFSIILHDGQRAYYLNFGSYPDLADDFRLREDVELVDFRRFCDARERTYYAHNAKFDMAMLAQHGIQLRGKIHDTMVTARVLDSTLWQGDFSLDACAKRIGYEKLDTVKEYLLANKLYTVETSEGKKTTKKNLHFDLAPWELITVYGEKDAEITFKLGAQQEKDVAELSLQCGALPPLRQVYENECQLVETVASMESRGVLIDRGFCQLAIATSQQAMLNAIDSFFIATGEKFQDSPKLLQKIFAAEADKWVYGKPTAVKGTRNPKFDSDVLATFASPAAAAILQWRKAKSDANYFHGFLQAADKDDVIHANFNQHIAATGRFSSSGPNLQNLTKTDDVEADTFLVRRAIVPRPGMVFHMLDFSQMEYRLMLDYAARFAVDKEGVLELIKKILGGLDVHQATADVAGVDRRSAKTVNFATLYGSGIANLAGRLGVAESRARDIRDSIFRAAPEIRTFIRRVTDTAEKRGFVVNWYGRRYLFPDATYAYRGPNYLVQGGCADIVKLAMNRIDAYLHPFQTKLVLTIHDELVTEGPPEEAAVVIPKVKEIMEKAYPAQFLPLTSGTEHSFKSLADKQEGISNVAAPSYLGRDSAPSR